MNFPAASFFLLALAALSSSSASAADSKETSQPHIVFILADDLGYGDLTAYNPDSKIPTPHLDKLAAAGMTFTDAHSGGSTCKPSRYALLTGRFAARKDNFNDNQPIIAGDRPTVAGMLRPKAALGSK